MARHIARPKIRLGLHYFSNEKAARSVHAACTEQGADCQIICSRLGSEATCRSLVDDFCAMGDPLSGIAVCSGTVGWVEWERLSMDHWAEMFGQHCIAPFFLARHAATRMSQYGYGSIVYLSSISAKYGGSPSTLHYAAAKSAVETSMRGLARIFARSGVRINGVRAGFVDTPQQRRGRTAEQIDARIGNIPMGRAGRPDEIASAFGYLLAEESSFITGEIITVAGGD